MSGDDIRDSAWERIANKPSMVIADGDPIEELAKAHERHATELERIATTLGGSDWGNLLGATAEGDPAMENIRIAVSKHPRSIRSNYLAEAKNARAIAAQLRMNKQLILRTESEGAAGVRAAIPN